MIKFYKVFINFLNLVGVKQTSNPINCFFSIVYKMLLKGMKNRSILTKKI